MPHQSSDFPDALILTLLAPQIPAAAVALICKQFAAESFKVASPTTIHQTEFCRIDLPLIPDSPLSPEGLAALHSSALALALELGSQLQIDIGVETAEAHATPKKLLFLDIDSTLIENEVINELAREKGNFEQIAAITQLSMQGKINFDDSLIRRVQTFRGLPASRLQNIFKRIRYTEGARELVRALKALGIKVGVISGGFSFVAEHCKRELALDFAFANELELLDGKLTGRVQEPILNAQKKADLLAETAQQLDLSALEVVAIGDGANDIPMLKKAGLGIAFNAKPIVREHANLALNQSSLAAVVYLLTSSPEGAAKALRGEK